MVTYTLRFKLQSDALFGRGDGLVGTVDAEVEHDQYGLPYLRGRALKGILEAECADILFALTDKQLNKWEQAAKHLFGVPGSQHQAQGWLHFGDALLPGDLRVTLSASFQEGKEGLTREAVLDALTTIRRLTSIDTLTGAPKETSLRFIRLILRDTPFESELYFTRMPGEYDKALLAACLKAFRRAGTSRNRGYGKLKDVILVDADEKPVLDDFFAIFKKAVTQ